MIETIAQWIDTGSASERVDELNIEVRLPENNPHDIH